MKNGRAVGSAGPGEIVLRASRSRIGPPARGAVRIAARIPRHARVAGEAISDGSRMRETSGPERRRQTDQRRDLDFLRFLDPGHELLLHIAQEEMGERDFAIRQTAP